MKRLGDIDKWIKFRARLISNPTLWSSLSGSAGLQIQRSRFIHNDQTGNPFRLLNSLDIKVIPEVTITGKKTSKAGEFNSKEAEKQLEKNLEVESKKRENE